MSTTSIPRRRRGGTPSSTGGLFARPSQSFTPTAPSTALPPDREIMEGLALNPVRTIQQLDIDLADRDIKINDFEYIGSYNWIKSPAESPMIVVPGSPPEWQNKPTPYQVPPDTGMVFSDQNGFRMPSAILLPLITAVDKIAEEENKPGFDWASVDFVTDRNGLRKLLRWIDGTATKSFRIDMQLAGTHSVLLNRWERRTREELPGFTYGFNFEKASTKATTGCEESTGHHRIVKYDLNGLKMVVRFEVDACIPSPQKPRISKPAPDMDDLADSLAGIKLSTPSSRLTSHSGSAGPISGTLKVIKGGSAVPQSSVVELATRSEFNKVAFNWKESFPQLFLSQTPHHFLALHRRGRFTTINKRRLAAPELQSIEREVQPSLKKLRRVLDVIKGMVIKSGQRGRLSLVCLDGELKVFERTSQDSCLPDDFMDLFDA